MTVRTSFPVTGFSNSDRCVRYLNELKTSRSANSATLLDVSTRVVRYGIAVATVGWMLDTLLRASRRVRTRGERGKLPRTVMSLSVKSIASCGYSMEHQYQTSFERRLSVSPSA